MRSEGSSLPSFRGKIIDRLSGLDPRKQALVRGLQVGKSLVYRTEYMDRSELSGWLALLHWSGAPLFNK